MTTFSKAVSTGTARRESSTTSSPSAPSRVLLVVCVAIVLGLPAVLGAQATAGPQQGPLPAALTTAGGFAPAYAVVAAEAPAGLELIGIDGTSKTLLPLPGGATPTAPGPCGVAFQPNSMLLVAEMCTAPETIQSFWLDPVNQALSPVGRPVQSWLQTGNIAFAPNGKVFVTTETGFAPGIGSHNVLVTYKVAANGKVERIGETPTQGEGPTGVAIDPDGQFALVAVEDSNLVSVFRIHGNSAAEFLWQFSTRQGPVAVAFNPTDSNSFAILSRGENVVSLIGDDGRGNLVVLGEAGTDAGANTVAFNDTGTQLFVLSDVGKQVGTAFQSTVAAYQIGSTRQLTRIADTPTGNSRSVSMVLNHSVGVALVVNRGVTGNLANTVEELTTDGLQPIDAAFTGVGPTAVDVTKDLSAIAMEDILQTAAEDLRFGPPQFGTGGKFAEDNDFTYTRLRFHFTPGGTTWMQHALSKIDPSVRFVRFKDKAIGRWTPWTQVPVAPGATKALAENSIGPNPKPDLIGGHSAAQ